MDSKYKKTNFSFVENSENDPHREAVYFENKKNTQSQTQSANLRENKEYKLFVTFEQDPSYTQFFWKCSPHIVKINTKTKVLKFTIQNTTQFKDACTVEVIE